MTDPPPSGSPRSPTCSSPLLETTPFIFNLTPPTPIKLTDPSAKYQLESAADEDMEKGRPHIDFEVSSTPDGEAPLYPYPMERIQRPSGGQPPQIEWVGSTSTESLDRRMPGPTPWAAPHRLNSPALGRSASTGAKTLMYALPLHRSTQSLPYYSRNDTEESIPAGDNRPLSPIAEGQGDVRASATSSRYHSFHESQEMIDSFPPSSSSHPAFISRPLKRSGSLSSAQSIGATAPSGSPSTAVGSSTVSSQPTLVPKVPRTPNIPQLDLRPQFHVTIPPRRAKGSPTTPHTPHTFASSPLKMSATPGDEASSWRTASFLTAPSIMSSHSSDNRHSRRFSSVGAEAVDKERETESKKSAVIGTSNESVASQSMHEFGAIEVVEQGGPVVGDTVRRSTLSSLTHSLREGTRSLLQFGRNRSEFPPRTPAKVDPARVLFWVGFIAPWTWLIGGWLLTDSKAMDTGGILPVYMQSKSSAFVVQEKGKLASSRLSVWNPVFAPSALSLAASSASGGSRFAAGAVAQMKQRDRIQEIELSRWIRRCRIAAIFGVFVTLVCFVVAVVVVARRL